MKNLALIFVILLSIPLFTYGQWRVTGCEELGLDPIEPGTGLRLLQTYLEGNGDGIGGFGCWVHHHPNGKDYIITPKSWGREPIIAKKGLIQDAMDALNTARNTYTEYGKLDSHLYYILDDINRTTREEDRISREHGNAFWLIRDACWMRSGVPTNRMLNRNQRKQIFAHEVGHCFIMENVPNLRVHEDLNDWFDESVAELLSSEAFPLTNLEHSRSRRYDLDGMEFTQDYRAYVFWYYLLRTKGSGELVRLMNELASLPTRETRLAFMREKQYDKDFHYFLHDFHQGNLKDSGDGTPIPREGEIEIMDDTPIELLPVAPITLDPVRPGRLTVVEIVLPANYDLNLPAPNGAGESFFLSLLAGDKIIKGWKDEESIKGDCNSETKIKVLMSHLNEDAITVKMSYELEEKEGCCGQNMTIAENPTEEELDGLFSFDHYIESQVSYVQNGHYQSSPMNYYVNSKDGSMLFTESWILENFGGSDNGNFSVDAVIWLPNRQLVGYVQDENFNQKRAITIDIDQMKGDVLSEQDIWFKEFLDKAITSGMSPAPLPSESPWTNNSTGYAFKRSDPMDKTKNIKYSGYISNGTANVSSPTASFGFMVGYIRDHQGKNKKLVYAKTEMQNGDMLEAHLRNIERKCFSFDGAGYKKLSLGGFAGGASNRTPQQDEDRLAAHDAYDKEMKELKEQLRNCRNETCATEIGKKILALEQQRRDDIYNRDPNSTDSGTAGTDMQNSMKAIQDRITILSKQLMDQARRCSKLQQENYRCDGCKKAALKACQKKSKSLGEEMEKLACQMAKLQGFGDMMKECQ
ncbi:hypothetical protein GTQ34_09640 [Muricauda sp. JGD-17]|uniref:Uncharacterized protein n=1 Tax=Flagellimonas ochracea TaxID=2696472 RepID=A0A964TDK4_9FLAO|nr:hypothetical protein [Allomuricauda ochracea]NAY92181.1 hypothetical protein [Allomuricauda ochracea]